MVITLKIFLIMGILLYFTLIFFFLKHKALILKYSLLWIITGIVMLFIVVFPHYMEVVANFLGIVSVVNAVFALELFFVMIILMSITSIVSRQNDKNKQLVQQIGLLEKRLRKLENNLNNSNNNIK